MHPTFKITRCNIPPGSNILLWNVDMKIDPSRFVKELCVCPADLKRLRPQNEDHRLEVETERRMFCEELRLLLMEKYADTPGYESVHRQPFAFDEIELAYVDPSRASVCARRYHDHEWA